jgi:lysozyme family protein
VANFRPAFEFLLPNEGGFTIDQGGATKFGISQRGYPDMSLDEIRDLTIAEAEAIYRRDYWEPNRYGAIDSQPIASKVFDLAVNMQGPGRHKGAPANKLLQGACVLCGAKIECDGVVGADTLNAVNQANEIQLMRNLVALAVARYKQIAQVHPEYAKDLGRLDQARQ